MSKQKIDEIKMEIYDNYCKHLAKANNVHLTSLDDLDQLTDLMHDICANCPLNKL